MKDGKVSSVRNWLMTARTASQEGPIILGVNSTPFKSTNILHIANELCENLCEKMKEFFPLDEVKKIFRNDYHVQQSAKARSLSQNQQSWVEMIKRNYMPLNVTKDEISDFVQPQKHRKAIYLLR